jgi:hypothetical protein
MDDSLDPASAHHSRNRLANAAASPTAGWLQRGLAVGRLLLGWALIIVGAILTISPLPLGFVLVMAGVALVGKRDRSLRRLRAAWRAARRRWILLQRRRLGTD